MKKIATLLLLLTLALLSVSCASQKTAEKSYSKIIKEYSTQLSRLAEGKDIDESSKDEIKNAILSAVNAGKDPSHMGYATKDLDGDGTEELFLISDTYDMYALFTLRDGKPSLLEVFNDGNGAIDYEGNIYSWSFGDKTSYYNRYRIADGELEGVTLTCNLLDNGESEYFCSFFGEESQLNASEWNNLINSYSKLGSSPKLQTRPSGLRFISALENETENDAPLADADSYDGIIEIYRAAISCFKAYSDEDYYAGKYDSAMTFEDDGAYEIYNRIFYSAWAMRAQNASAGIDYFPNGDDAYGYITQDIGGSEDEELILLNDEYGIIAIFTMKNSSPALLYNYYGGELEININGDFFISYYTPNHTEWRVYELNDRCDLELINFAGFFRKSPNNERYYSIEDGKYTVGEQNDYSQVISSIMRGEHPAPHPVKYCLGDGFIRLFDTVKLDKSYENKTLKRPGDVSNNKLTLSNVSESGFEFSFTYIRTYLLGYTYQSYEAEIKASATADGNGYVFDNGTVSGRIEFGVNTVWVDIKESKDTNIECYPLLFEAAD